MCFVGWIQWFTVEVGESTRLLLVENRKIQREEDKRRAKGIKVN
jgi:hypothetical protein